MNGTRSVYFEISPSQSHSDRDYHRWKSICCIRSVGGIARHCSSTANRTPLIFVAHLQFPAGSATSRKARMRYVKAVIGCWIERILELRREDRGVYIRYEYYHRKTKSSKEVWWIEGSNRASRVRKTTAADPIPR